MTELKITNLYKRYGSVEVLRDVNLDIKSGEFVVFVGPSGCGKSTLLRTISGLDSISSGTIEIDGKVVNYVAPADRGIAMVFQSYALYPHMTVFDNMAYSLKIRRASKAEIKEKIGKAAEMLQLTQYLNRHPEDLSGGQRQRVAIGRAIVRDPKVFLFDEPLSNLDAALRGATRMELASLNSQLEDTTMIYVTHDQVEAMTLADRIVVLKDGEVQQVGTPKELYEKPVNMFVAQFIGSPKMNIFKGHNADKFDAHAIGIRPEDLAVRPEGGDWTGKVIHTENLGSDTFVYLDIGAEEPAIVRAKGNAEYHPGDQLGFSVHDGLMHRFSQDGYPLSHEVIA
jgi:multiple sugar transport system ATP-binding protein